MWQGIAGIFRCTFGTQTVDNPDFALGHQLNGDPILLVDILPKGRAFESFTEEEKASYTAPYRREVTRGGLSAYKPAGVHINSKIANNPLKVRLILVPFFMQCIRHMADGVFGDSTRLRTDFGGTRRETVSTCPS